MHGNSGTRTTQRMGEASKLFKVAFLIANLSPHTVVAGDNQPHIQSETLLRSSSAWNGAAYTAYSKVKDLDSASYEVELAHPVHAQCGRHRIWRNHAREPEWPKNNTPLRGKLWRRRKHAAPRRNRRPACRVDCVLCWRERNAPGISEAARPVAI